MHVKYFQIGDNVAVTIPKIDRSKVDVRRLPAVVVKLKNSRPPMYKLACQYGTLQAYFSTSDIISYPGVVHIANEDYEISLRETARLQSVTGKSVVICKCHKKCDTKRCACKKHHVACHSRCHSGRNCHNNKNDVALPMLPSYGGCLRDEYFSNTCPVDNWLAMLTIVSKEKPNIYEELCCQVNDDEADLLLLLQYIKTEKFLEAKFILATMNSLVLNAQTYDFYGNESKFTKFMQNFFQYQMSSICSSIHCPEREICQTINKIPSQFHVRNVQAKSHFVMC